MTGPIYIPIEPGGKRPLVSKWSVPDVTPAQVQAWWADVPDDVNKALRLDHVLVVDCDVDKAALAGRPDPLAWWQATGGAQATSVVVKTPHGFHFYYQRRPELAAGPLKRSDGTPMDIDIKTGAGHYVLVPPSVLADGGRYRWA